MAPAGLARPVGRPYEGEGTEPSAAPGSRRGRLRYGRADEAYETSVRSSVSAPLAKRSGPLNFRERRSEELDARPARSTSRGQTSQVPPRHSYHQVTQRDLAPEQRHLPEVTQLKIGDRS
jgi:hypothetical protein